MPCSPSSDATPETAHALVAILDRTGTLFDGNAPEELVTLCRKLERERDELRKVARHCRLFIGERRGYRNNEEMERDDICKRIDAILPENRDSTTKV